MEENNTGEFRKVLLIPNIGKNGITDMVIRVGEWLEGHGAEYHLLPGDAEALGLEGSRLPGRIGETDIDLAVVLGGDGTILHAVEVLREIDVPMMGINIGKMGFLTAAEMHHADSALTDIFEGRYWVSERHTIGCSIKVGEREDTYRALNEIVIGKLAKEKIIHLSTYINGEFFMMYSGDGLIFSSATGSTAYSLSSGGPIVTPVLRCFLLTPICAHMLFSRPMVMDGSDRVTVVMVREPERLALSIDGRLEVEVPQEARVEFYTPDKTVKILELLGSSFYQTLREKFLSPPVDEV